MKVKIKDKEYEVEVSEISEDELKIKIGEKEFFFGEKKEKEKISIAKTSFPKRSFSKKEIKAQIAGTISEIFVKEGDFIKKDQKVLILSSMKMENEIVTDFEGKVKKVLVKKNQPVKEGDILVMLG